MRPKSKANNDLPNRMIRRKRVNKKGKITFYYFYNCKGTKSKQKEIPLGKDLAEAKVKWAESEKVTLPKKDKILKKHTLGYLFDLFMERIAPERAFKTQQGYKEQLTQLRKVFENAPIKSIKPFHIAQYRDARSAKVRANREVSTLRVIYNYAIEWGMAEYNPAKEIKKNKEKPRTYYAEDDVFFSVYKNAKDELKDTIMLAYLTGQRPADIHKIEVTHITNDHLFVGQNKTGHKLKIKLNNEKGRNALGIIIDHILSKKKDDSPYLISINGQKMSNSMRRHRFEDARLTAINEALKDKKLDLADRIKQFQFRDIRPKSASDMNDVTLASKLLGHSKEDITRRIYVRKGQEVEPLEPQNKV